MTTIRPPIASKWQDLLKETDLSEEKLRTSIPNGLRDTVTSLSYALLAVDHFAGRIVDDSRAINLRKREKKILEKHIQPHIVKRYENNQPDTQFIQECYHRSRMHSDFRTQALQDLKAELMACEKFKALSYTVNATPPIPPERFVTHLSRLCLIEHSLNEMMHKTKIKFSEKIRLMTDDEEWVQNQFDDEHQVRKTEFGGNFPCFAEKYRKALITSDNKEEVLRLFDHNFQTYVASDEQHVKETYAEIKNIVSDEVDQLMKNFALLEKLNQGEEIEKKSNEQAAYVIACLTEARTLSPFVAFTHQPMDSERAQFSVAVTGSIVVARGSINDSHMFAVRMTGPLIIFDDYSQTNRPNTNLPEPR